MLKAADKNSWSVNDLLLDANGKDYYVMVQATAANGLRDTEYSWSIADTSEKFNVNNNDDLFTGAQKINLTDGKYATSNEWVGFGDAKDYYSFVAIDGAMKFDLAYTGDETGTVTLKIYDSNRRQVGKTLTINSRTGSISSGELCLTAGQTYYVEIVGTEAARGNNAAYRLDISSWEFGTANANTGIGSSEILPFDGKGVAKVEGGKVWKAGASSNYDTVNYYKVQAADGNYTLELDGINGNAIRATIGTVDAKGNFRALQSVVGKAGAESLMFSRKLAAGEYFIKIETNGNNVASRYDLTMTNNDLREGFSNDDDTWKLVAGDASAKVYGNNDSIENWVGFGDNVDVFKVRTDSNGQLVFAANGDEDTAAALINREITLALADGSGRNVSLAFDKSTGAYTSNIILMADAEYYLTVRSSNPNNRNNDFNISVKLK